MDHLGLGSTDIDTDTWHDMDTKTHQIHKITGHGHDVYILKVLKNS